MYAQIDIGFEQLVNVIESLPKNQLSQLKELIEKREKQKSKQSDLELLLLNGPVATKAQLKTIENSRKAINQWHDFT